MPWKKYGVQGGGVEKTPVIPDGPDDPTPSDVLQCLADIGLATGCRVSRFVRWFLAVMVRCLRYRIREGGEQFPHTFFEMAHSASALHLHRSERSL